MLTFARDATHRHGISLQPFKIDVSPALATTVDATIGETSARSLDFLQCAHVTFDPRIVDLDQFVGDRLIAQIMHHTGKIKVTLVAELQKCRAYVFTQLPLKRVKLFLENRDLCSR